jgi:cleavage and polyadenylation specificity factor subunit 1
LIGTIHGCVGIFIPIDERIYRRLALLQQLMAVGVETCCNLNPTEFRTMKSSKFKLDWSLIL